MGSEAKQEDLDIRKIMEMTISKEEIEKQNISAEDLIEINFGAQLLGPVKIGDLKSYLGKSKIGQSKAEIKSLAEKDWKPLFEHPVLQKRKPQLVSSDELKSENQEDFFVLKNGRKFGPFRFEQIEEKIKIQQILFTDLISVDGGENWAKIHEITSFDRRRKRESDLPPPPLEKIFKDGTKRQKEKLKSGGKSGEAEAMAILAKFGVKKSDDQGPENFEEENENKADLSFKKFVGLFILGLLIFGGFFLVKKFALNEKTKVQAPKSRRSEKTKKLFKPKTNVRAKNAQGRPSKVRRPIKVTDPNSIGGLGKGMTDNARMNEMRNKNNRERELNRDRNSDKENDQDDPYKDDDKNGYDGDKPDLVKMERNKLKAQRKSSRRKTGRTRRRNDISEEEPQAPGEAAETEFENEEIE